MKFTKFFVAKVFSYTVQYYINYKDFLQIYSDFESTYVKWTFLLGSSPCHNDIDISVPCSTDEGLGAIENEMVSISPG